MVSPSGLFGGSARVLLSLPFLLYPERVARMPYRFARHLEPEEPDVREARVLGVLIFLLGVGMILFA